MMNLAIATKSPHYIATLSPDDLMLGDFVRRVGRPLAIGLVVGFDGDVVLVKWRVDGPADRRHYMLLERRI